MKPKLDELCRLCGNFDSHLMPIFAGDGLEHNLPRKIKKHLFSVTIKENDNLPQKLCYQCVSSVVNWSDLFEHSRKVDKNFQNELKKLALEKCTRAKEPEITLVDAFRNDDITENVTVENARDMEKIRSTKENLLEENIAAMIFDEINDFDAFLNDSPSSSVSLESDIGSSENEEDITEQTEAIEVQNDSDNSDFKIELSNSQPNSQIQTNIPTNDDSNLNSVLPNNDNPTSTQTENEQTVDLTNDNSTQPVKKKRKYKPKDPDRGKLSGCMCHICGKLFKVPETMKIHVKTVHSVERPHVCPICNTSFKRKDHLDCHVRYKHGNEKYPKRPCTQRGNKGNSRQRLCVHCGKILSSTHLLKEHINSFHSNLQPYKCEQCNISFRRYSNLYHHSVTRKHKLANFHKPCEICGLDFQSETFYLRHKWKHTETVYCDICQTQFENHEFLKQHVEDLHEDKKLLQCDTCGKKFRTKASLKIHVRVHTGEKPYQCQYCAWRFHKKGQLVVHIYRHTGERPYVCSICGRGFKQRGDMRKHKMGHIKQMKKNLTA